MRRSESGFTFAEILIALTCGILAVGLFYQQWQYSAMNRRDSARKTSVNAIHYYLNEVQKKETGSYPLELDKYQLKGVDQTLMKDPDGNRIGDPKSSIRYIPGDCSGNKCARYELRADLEKEEDFIRTNGWILVTISKLVAVGLFHFTGNWPAVFKCLNGIVQ